MKKSFLLIGAVLAMAATTLPAHATERFWVNNRSDSEISEVYLVKRNGEWSDDLLGQNGTIPARDKVQVLSTNWPGCRYDVRVYTYDNQFAHFRNFDTCVGPLNVNNKGLRFLEDD